ncbi:unnamed protein product [Mytilus coruscus]|uniref:TET-Associated Glycosyltransferase domain-containing protein n=1 Tax=Mytilus coruscus TaxID=42192 RepID=A0A6J8EAE3_MYTCO|nr:unnamed protein product [Mytilus coruscus]
MAEAANTTDEITAEDSNQTNIANETEASNESQVPGDESVQEIDDALANISLVQCSFCNDDECNFGKRPQHWTGDIFKSQDPKFTELKDPKYVKTCPLPDEFINGTGENQTINLSKIVKKLHRVVDFIKEPSSPYKELENLINNRMEENATTPYTDEIKQYATLPAVTSWSDIHYIDCEYMLKVSIPRQSAYSAFLDGKMFIPKDHKTTEENKERDKFRWIFIPSSDRFDKNVKLDRSRFQNEGEMSRDDTLCFVVVRENQFEKYHKQIGNKVPIIQLPEIVIGVGYARFWIIKIAKRFQLEHIWMIDDSVDIFKEYIPIQNGNRCEKDPDASKQDINIRCPSYCFKKMENIMEKQPNLVAISPRKYTPRCNVTYEFSYKPIQSVMLLNITKITEKNINFRPELRYMEDMIFSQECTNAGLELCTWNAIMYVDKQFSNTGAKTTCQSARGKTQTREK